MKASPPSHESGRAEEAAELLQAGAALPGVSDLIRLYQTHQVAVDRANALMQPGRVAVVTSGNGTAG